MATDVAVDRLDFVWLELTGRCQLRCSHCYSASGPEGDHGTMTTADWRRVIDQAAELGIREVQLIGGEPTLHPDLPELIQQALGHGLAVEVYSNLVRITDALWDVFELPGVRLATSYYSSDAIQHDAVTGRRSHGRTLANIREALRRGIPLRVGLVDVEEGQDVDGAVAELRVLGVKQVRVDRVRQVGRGVNDQQPGVDQLCGACADASLAILPSGEAIPCVLSRWLTLGNVRNSNLATINQNAAGVRAELTAAFMVGGQADGKPKCDPKCVPRKFGPKCEPYFNCDPKNDKDGCGPKKK